MSYLCYKWGECDVPWNLADWTWSECRLVADLIAAPPFFPNWLNEPVGEDEEQKKQRFIRLLCRVKGEPLYDKKKLIKENIKVTAKDVELVVKAVAGIDLKVEKEDVNYGLLPIHRQK
jgi:hypothetical protein